MRVDSLWQWEVITGSQERGEWRKEVDEIKRWIKEGNTDKAFHEETIRLLEELIKYNQWAEYDWNTDGQTQQQKYNYKRQMELRTELGQRIGTRNILGIPGTAVQKVKGWMGTLQYKFPPAETFLVDKEVGVVKRRTIRESVRFERPGSEAVWDYLRSACIGVSSGDTIRDIAGIERDEPTDECDGSRFAAHVGDAIAADRKRAASNGNIVKARTAVRDGKLLVIDATGNVLREALLGVTSVTVVHWTCGTDSGYYYEINDRDNEYAQELGGRALASWYGLRRPW